MNLKGYTKKYNETYFSTASNTVLISLIFYKTDTVKLKMEIVSLNSLLMQHTYYP